MTAEVDAGLGHRRDARGRDILQGQHRISLVGGFVRAGSDDSVAMGVLQLLGNPRRRVLGHLVRVQLAGGQQELQVLITQLVAVDRHFVGVELVIGAQALEVFQGIGECQLRIPEPCVLDSLRITGDGVSGQCILGREGPVGNTGEAVRLSGEVDHVLDVGRLARELTRRHLKSLDDARKDHEQDECRPQPGDERYRQRRQSPNRRVGQQPDGDQRHQDHHDPVRGNASRGIGVANPVDELAPTPGQQQLIQIEPVVDGEQRGEDGGQHREVSHRPRRQDQILEPGT